MQAGPVLPYIAGGCLGEASNAMVVRRRCILAMGNGGAHYY
jgi:hypothetical protein